MKGTYFTVHKIFSYMPVLFLAWALSPTASATTLIFGQGGTSGFTSGGVQSTGAVAVPGAPGLTLEVQALSTWNSPAEWLIDSAAGGYGVDNGGVDVCLPFLGHIHIDDDPAIDSSGGDDTLRLIFSQPVTLSEILIGDIDVASRGLLREFRSDAVDISNLGAGTVYSGSLLSLGPGIGTLSGASLGNTTGTVFDIRVLDYNDDVRLRGISFDNTSVPEPATCGLIGLGLVMIGLARRRHGQ